MKRALVLGSSGQDGSYLCELLLAKGYETHGTIRRSSSFNTGRIATAAVGLHAGIEGIRVHGKHAAGGRITKDGGVVYTKTRQQSPAECLESTSYGGLKSEKTT